SLNLNTDLRKKFSIDPNVVFLNHGSYGSIPTGVRTIQQAWTNAFDRQPIQFFDHFFPYMASSIRCVADFINVEPANIVLVPNATTATKTVLNNLNIQASDTILVTSLMYDAVDCTVGEISSRIGCTINVLTLTVPTSPKAIIDAFANYFKTCTKLPRLAILDHITSATALVFPIKEIVQICRNYGVLTIVDGAHAVGSVPIDLKGLECDFYFSNLHKWSFTPIGTAFLYVHPKHQESFRPLLVSYGYPLGFQAEFMYVGTMDYTPYLTIDAGIAFYQSI
ncbi:pyridoxal phosphate-dependent transferase, partial [Globomyces pollinis-pini]